MWDGFDFTSKETGPDYYAILGCSETATTEQITAEYRVQALKHHPDKNRGNEKALEAFQKLQEARDALVDPEKRKIYDDWRRCGVGVTFKQWKSINERCQMTMHWATPKMTTMLEGERSADPFRNNDWSETTSKGQIGDIRWGKMQGQSWESDNQRGVYSQFRNYKI